MITRIYDSSGSYWGKKDGVHRMGEYFICYLEDNNGSLRFVYEWFKDKNKWELIKTKVKGE